MGEALTLLSYEERLKVIDNFRDNKWLRLQRGLNQWHNGEKKQRQGKELILHSLKRIDRLQFL